jgi:hypothetical protein
MILQLFPAKTFALTGGPSQPEVETFQSIEVTDMVDPATGDFSYNIPLMEVGGYPINLIYNAGITMDQEASMVGLGWNINPGAITRSVRGIPDDFKGDEIEKEVDMKDNHTWGFSFTPKFEFFGIGEENYSGPQLGLNVNLGLNHSNYDGFGLEFGLTPVFSGGDKCLPGLCASLGLTASSKEGLGFSPNISYSNKMGKESNKNLTQISGSLGTNINSRQGFKALTYSVSANLMRTNDKSGKRQTNEERLLKNPESSNVAASISGNAFDYSTPSYIPKINYPIQFNNFTFQASVAFEGLGAFAGIGFNGYYSKQSLQENYFSTQSYGIAYLEEGKLNSSALLDFNRENDGAFTKDKPNLPLPYITNDIFSVSGQGIGGSYQLFRGDIGVVFDRKANNSSGGYSLGVEIGAGALFRLGGDIHTNFVNSYTGKWLDDINLFDNLNFQLPINNQSSFEPSYFKAAGEASPYITNSENILANTGSFAAAKVILDKSGSEVINTNNLKANFASPNTISNVQKRSNRSKRNQSVSFLTSLEAKHIGLEKKIRNFTLSTSPSSSTNRFSEIDRQDDVTRKKHHISEITVVRPDGLRYIYGIAAYNNSQYEVTFNVNRADFTPDCNTGLINYEPENIDHIKPKHKYGLDNFLDIEKTPAFAHSYLLTAIISEDYVDLSGDGPSPDDLGTYTKFNYSRLHQNYTWRVPYEQANFNAGFQSKTNDDKGNFTYGEKEIWLLHSIESKTQIAEFYYEDRKDGHGVLNFKGGRDSDMNLKRLVQIVLYSSPDYMQNPSPTRSPIKSVHFEYDYSLCPENPTNIDYPSSNATDGKLTLKKLYFKYGNSNKGKFSPYTFTYAGDPTIFPSQERGINPPYRLKGYNRWGGFSHVNIKTHNDNFIDCNAIDRISSSDYTFIEQRDNDIYDEQRAADESSSAWCLKQINLPSGGKINIDYEADDYGYVQDKKAMQLFEIIGSSSSNSQIEYSGQDIALYDDSGPKNYLFFKLSEPIPSGLDTRNYIWNHYVKEAYFSDNLFFKIYSNLDNSGHYEYVQGYTEIEDFGTYNDGSEILGYLKVKNACTKDRVANTSGDCTQSNITKTSPLAKTAWQFARLQLPRLVYGNLSSDTPSDDQISEDAEDFATIGNSFRTLFYDFGSVFQGGINNKLLEKNYSKFIRNGKSWIRLSNPFWDKLAGTHRVKKLTISDEWDKMTNNANLSSFYGQEFDYTKNYKLNSDTLKISSGVSSYEPIIGSEENPFRIPITYHQENKMAPDDDYYNDSPIGESLFPSPSVVYSEVKVSNLQQDHVTKKATGWTIHKYYTGFDYPIKVSQTTLDAYPKKTKLVFKFLFNIKHQDFMTASQGYAIELNDMHGKPRSMEVYNQNGTLISGLTYHYKTSLGELSNSVDLMLPSGDIADGTIGIDYSIIADQREAKSKTFGVGVNMNNDNFMIGPIPVPAFVPIPFFNNEKTRFRSIVLTKTIHRTGILGHTTAYDLGSTVTTQNLLWDGITGEVLLTRTSNEFEDPIYNFNYPAHWAYKGMQCAYQNINAAFTPSSYDNTTKEVTVSSSAVFVEGDELLVNGADKYWVKSKNGNKLLLIDFDGTPITSLPSTIKVIRSGHRNKASTSIASIVSLLSPITGSSLNINGSKQIINAGAVEFDDKRYVNCCAYECPRIDLLKNKIPIKVIFNEFLQQIDFENLASTYQPCTPTMNGYLSQIFNPVSSLCSGGAPYYISKSLWSGLGLNIRINLKSSSGCECFITTHLPEDTKYVSIIDYRTSFEDGAGVDITGNYIKCYNCGMGPLVNITKTNGDISQSITNFISRCFNFYSGGGVCYPEFEFTPINNYGNGLESINPYTTNHRGTFTPKKSYAFLAQRKSSASNTVQPNLKQDGYFTNSSGSPYFSPFWNKNVGSSTWTPNKTNWTWTAEVTKIHPNGNELESRDPLNRYSSELLGYNDQMVVAVAGNARYGDCFFEGFEDYKYTLGSRPSLNCPSKKYFEFPSIAVTKDLSKSHSGKYFLALANNSTAATSYPLSQSCLEDSQVINPETDTTENNINCNCLNLFNPKPGKYVFSAWINASRDPLIHQFDNAKCEVILDGITNTFKASGPIIEGWQRIYGEFQIPMNSKKITVRLLADPDNWTYFDDIRIHPFDASLKSFVYDDITLRFTYELDENNYFTKYEYDDSGKLERVKKETERGVMTIQETRFSNVKKQ